MQIDSIRLVPCLVLLLGSCESTLAGSNIYLGQRTTPSSISMNDVDHGVWSELVSTYVDDQGLVNYRAWLASKRDRGRLTTYLSHLSSASHDVAASRSAKLAFWINAYNAVTVEGILREYPTSSIRNHTAKLFGYNIWDDLQLYVGGVAHSLNEMEHEILRPMGEPRIHFAIVCASMGCPRLLNEAYTAENLDKQLQRNAKHFFAQPANFKLSGSNVQVSSILKWFSDDFGTSDPAVLRRIRPWLEPADAAKLRETATLSYLSYDWSINAQ
ncbi:MAG: DUF547 domain-containing protein [Planctomycetota bacterium]